MLSKAVRVQNKTLVNATVSSRFFASPPLRSRAQPDTFSLIPVPVFQKAAFAAPSHTRAAPTIFHKALNIVDKGTTAYQVSKYDPTQVLQVSSSDVAFQVDSQQRWFKLQRER